MNAPRYDEVAAYYWDNKAKKVHKLNPQGTKSFSSAAERIFNKRKRGHKKGGNFGKDLL